MLIQPFKKVFITQPFGVNEHIYKRFGYKGHNGIDYRLFDKNGNKATKSEVYAPHDGVIKERRNDADGYGLYLKLESETEGSVLAHLDSFLVNINKHVKQGDLIAIADNTGWSTGSHLHWGYYRLPRNRDNGYGGFIDQTPYIGTDDIIDPDMPDYLKGLLKDQLQIDITSPEGDVRGRIGEITDKLKNYDDLQKQVTKLEKENISLEGQVGQLEREFQALSESRDRLTTEVESLKKEVINEQSKTAKRDETIVDLQNQIDELKESIDPDSKVIISKSEYERLQRRKTTDRLTDTELLRAWLERKWEALKGIFTGGE